MTESQRLAMLFALNLIHQRDHTTIELTEKLGSKFSPDDVSFVLQFATQHHLIDENRTANMSVRRNVGRRAVGDQLLREKLRGKGVPEDLIEEAFRNAESTEIDRAKEVLDSKFPQGATRAKAARYLGSRGFSEDTIESILGNMPDEAYPEEG
jgi:regulatory protein